MRIDTYFTLDEVDPPSLVGATVVVVDVIRATTTITEALANGAKSVLPTTSTEEAVRLATSLGREDTLLCGERKGAKVEGFDLGNSPREFTADVVRGKRLVMSTTNGTRAFVLGHEADLIFACALTNLGAVAAALTEAERIVVLCAGREDRFSIDDALCAGALIERIAEGANGADLGLNDASRAARALAGAMGTGQEVLRTSAGGRALIEIGLGPDLEVCAEVDRHDIVPRMRDQVITVAAG